MARQARQKSKSGIYHIILRGINRQVIFEDDEDKSRFLECVQYYSNICACKVYGYCLMDNHVHLLIKETEEEIASIMKRIGVRYVAWYNRKYDRCGHLFQDRFKSEVIEDDAYLLVVLRYIHQNPLKAGLIQSLSDFKFSSYDEYINTSQIVDSNFILGMFSIDSDQARKGFAHFMRETSANDDCLKYREQITPKDEEVRMLIKKYANVSTPRELQAMEKSKRDAMLREIKKIQGITTRQIARLTGISQSVITRA
ncbi:transposase [Sporomusa aerivorans]|uniref:transposase n=1 Tax=Sporomusa aerivorans TaxID=204936 RepID=UPI00352A044A